MFDYAKMKRLREKLKLTQEEAAQQGGLTGRQQWCDIESGRRPKITLTTLDKIAAALGCKPKDLMK
jgi:DNA-binding Xre family transcriptional regulator